MKRISLTVACIVAVIFGAFTLFAKDQSPVAALKPLMIDVRQAVPVMAEVILVNKGEAITATVPFTVDIDMQIGIRGVQIYTMTMTNKAQPAKIAISTPAATGSTITINGIEWTLISAKDLGQTLKRSGFRDTTTDGEFISVVFDVKNTTDGAVRYSDINLIDADGRIYEPSSEAAYTVKDIDRCSYDEIGPGLKRHCNVIYDVPAQATSFKLEFTSLDATRDKKTQLVPFDIK